MLEKLQGRPNLEQKQKNAPTLADKVLMKLYYRGHPGVSMCELELISGMSKGKNRQTIHAVCEAIVEKI